MSTSVVFLSCSPNLYKQDQVNYIFVQEGRKRGGREGRKEGRWKKGRKEREQGKKEQVKEFFSVKIPKKSNCFLNLFLFCFNFTEMMGDI